MYWRGEGRGEEKDIREFLTRLGEEFSVISMLARVCSIDIHEEAYWIFASAMVSLFLGKAVYKQLFASLYLSRLSSVAQNRDCASMS